MSSFITPPLSVCRRTPIFACLAAAGFALGVPASGHASTTWAVDTCVDDNSGDANAHTGSLRFAVVNAAKSGDTIEMTGLPALKCSTISLLHGAIGVTQHDLILNGPGADKLTITGESDLVYDRLFNHQGTGTLTISNLTMISGHVSRSDTPALGGCIFSKGNVLLDKAIVSECKATSSASTALGGGVYTLGDLTTNYSTISNNISTAGAGVSLGGGAYVNGSLQIQNSTVSSNTASSSTSYGGLGGGAYVRGSFNAQSSTVNYNFATNSDSTRGYGGGLYLHGNVTIVGTTISGNSSSGKFGGVELYAPAGNATAVIKNSTISGNHATLFGGGLYSNVGHLSLLNSTIAFNTAGQGQNSMAPFGYYSPGVAISTFGSNVNATLQSSLVSNNTYGPSGTEADLSVAAGVGFHTASFSGAGNLIRTPLPFDLVLPSGTIKTACPLLGPLRDNGGPTFTHALLSHSPAIDLGNNSANLSQDQRGEPLQPYPRVDHGFADIGAYEVQQGDIIFNAGFDGCPDFI